MGQLKRYNEQQARFDWAFCCSGTCCDVTCEQCGRTYFVTSPGHGDYLEGELDRLRARSQAEPEKFIEVPDFSNIASIVLGGKQVVIGCVCDPTKNYTDWIESHAEELTEYLKDYWAAKKKQATAEVKDATERIAALAVS